MWPVRVSSKQRQVLFYSRMCVVNRVMAQEGAAGIAAAVAESVQYQGRKASRRGSEQRRQDILDAAMRIVVRDGVRAVRHRAVAAEAPPPPPITSKTSTTCSPTPSPSTWNAAPHSAAARGGTVQPESRSQLADDIARLTADYVLRQLTNRREYLMAEQAFRQEALLNPRLAELVRPSTDPVARHRAVFPGIGFP